MPVRLVVLGVAVAVHSIVAQLLYAGLLVDVAVPIEELRGGAALMYYGGDIPEILLAFALVSTWRPRVSNRPASAAASGRVLRVERDVVTRAGAAGAADRPHPALAARAVVSRLPSPRARARGVAGLVPTVPAQGDRPR